MLSPEPGLPRALVEKGKAGFKSKIFTVGIDTPGLGLLKENANSGILNSWVRGKNKHAVTCGSELYVPKNIERTDLLRHGLKGDRLCLATQIDALIGMHVCGRGAEDPQPLIVDGTPFHRQAVDYDDDSGDHAMDEEKFAAKTYLEEAMRRRRTYLVQGTENGAALSELIQSRKPIVLEATDEALAELIDDWNAELRDAFGMEKLSAVIVTKDPETGNVCVFVLIMQISSTIGGPTTVHRVGNAAIGFLHEMVRLFLKFAGAKEPLAKFKSEAREAPNSLSATKPSPPHPTPNPNPDPTLAQP